MGKWLSPADTCDICKDSLEIWSVFYDGKVRKGSWALMCPTCFDRYGVGLGTGLGQKYDYHTKEKIEG